MLPSDNSLPAVMLKIVLLAIGVAMVVAPLKSFLSGREAQRAHTNTLVRSMREVAWDSKDAATVVKGAVPAADKLVRSLPGKARRLSKSTVNFLTPWRPLDGVAAAAPAAASQSPWNHTRPFLKMWF